MSSMTSVKEVYDSLPVWAKLAVGSAALALPTAYWLWRGRERKSPLKEDWESGVVYLYQFPRTNYIPNIFEPFGLSHVQQLENVNCSWTTRSREGMLPFVELNGKEYPDSGLAIRDLTKLLGKDHLERSLTNEEKAIARAFEQMIENTTLWYASYGYMRYMEHIDEILSEKILGVKIPLLMRMFMPNWLMISRLKTRMYYQGIGRHPKEEIINIGFDDLRAMSQFLGSKPYMMGKKATRVDATLFSLLSQILYLPIETPHREFVKTECKNLVEHTDRMKEQFWSDWEETCRTKSLNTKWKKDE